MFNNLNKQVFLGVTLMFIISVASCKKIIEEDITEKTPTLILPKMNDTIEINPIHFKWNEMEGATKYHLELVSPSFSNISSYNLDSIVTGSNFFFSLDSNEYEFRITAMNGAYSSKSLDPISFVVGTSIGTVGSSVSLNSPDQNQYFNEQFNGNFSWFTLPGTNSYTFELHESSSFAGVTLDYLDQISTNSVNSLTGQTLGEGTFVWGIKAFLSDGTETNYSKRVFYIDTIAPGSSTLNSPSNNATQPSGNISFDWSLPADIGVIQAPVLSILQIANDASFNSMLTPDTTSLQSFSKSLTQGTYYWRVRTIDQAGNLGSLPTSYHVLNITL